MSRTILHCDLDAFFCAVEELGNPALQGIPFAVGARPEARGVVASCSYAARAFGVRSAMPMSRALRLCPSLTIVPPAFPAYRAASEEVMARLNTLSPLVEQISIDEAFVDVSDASRPGDEIARELQAQIRDELQLPCSLGVASNKLVAKIATDVGKARATPGQYPNAICVVPAGEEAAFLAPLSVSALWGVGPKTAERLAELGVRYIGDLARWEQADLLRRFGKHGAELAQQAQGIDERPLVTEHVAKSISKETTFSRDVRDLALLRQVIQDQAESVARKLRQEQVTGTVVKLKLRWANFVTVTRQLVLPRPTDDPRVIAAFGQRLLGQLWGRSGGAVRLIGVGVSGLGQHPIQLSLFDSEPTSR